jgi:hypothetical protein
MPTLTDVRAPTLSLLGLAEELTRRKDAMRDYIVDTRKVSVASADGDTEIFFDDETGASTTGHPINDYAHGQIAERLGIPKRYYDRMRTDAPSLLDTNVMNWMWGEPERRLIRTLDGRVRAFLSDRYRRLDNFDLMEHLLPVLGEIDGLNFHVASLTDLRLYVRAILPGLQAEIKVGQIVQAGVEIRNSEVGAGRFEVGPYLWKLDCLNGMVSNVGRMARAHVGSRVGEISEDGFSVFANDTIEADDKAFFLAARDLVKNALTDVTFEAIVESMRKSTEAETRVGDVIGATEKLASTFDLSDGERSSVLASLIEGGDLSQWGVANAVTATARDVDDYDRLVDLEEIGGRIVEMPRGDWRSISTAVAAA